MRADACAVQPVLGQSSLASGTGPEPLQNQGFSWNQELLAGEIFVWQQTQACICDTKFLPLKRRYSEEPYWAGLAVHAWPASYLFSVSLHEVVSCLADRWW